MNEMMHMARYILTLGAIFIANCAYAYSNNAAFACRATAFYALKDNTIYPINGADFFTIKLKEQKAYFDNGGFFENSVNEVVFNLSKGLETRSVTSHFKLNDGQFWYAMATLGYTVMGQGSCDEL